MATVTIKFTDQGQGRMDGACHLSFTSDPPIVTYEDATPVMERLSLAQKQALVALGAVQAAFNVVESSFPRQPLEDFEQAGS